MQGHVRMFRLCIAGAAVLWATSIVACDDRGPQGAAELPPHAEVPVAATTPPPAPVVVVQPQAQPLVVKTPENPKAPIVPAPKAWPRKMEIDPVSGYVKCPPAKVAHPPRIIAWFPIGNSDSLVANRMIGWNIKKDGWAGFVNTWVEPAIALGFDAVQLHNPGGTRPVEEMQADQFLDAKDDGVDWISRGFVEAWRPVTQRVPVIAYIGMLPKNERFEGLLKRGDRAGFLQAITDSYRLPLEARMDIAFDAMHMVPANGWEVQVYQLLGAMGVKTYIEPIPNVLDTALYGANFEVVNTTLDRALTNGEPWVPAFDLLSGERIVLLAEPPKGKTWKTIDTWLPGWLQHWTGQGWSVAINPADLIRSRTRPWDLIKYTAGGVRR